MAQHSVTGKQNPTFLSHSTLHFSFASSTLVALDLNDVSIYII